MTHCICDKHIFINSTIPYLTSLHFAPLNQSFLHSISILSFSPSFLIALWSNLPINLSYVKQPLFSSFLPSSLHFSLLLFSSLHFSSLLLFQSCLIGCRCTINLVQCVIYLLLLFDYQSTTSLCNHCILHINIFSFLFVLHYLLS